MRRLVVGAVALGLSLQAGFAMDPEEAGRQGRRDLRALMEKQRKDRKAAVARKAEEAAPAPPAKTGRAAKPIGNRLPTICRGCGV